MFATFIAPYSSATNFAMAYVMCEVIEFVRNMLGVNAAFPVSDSK